VELELLKALEVHHKALVSRKTKHHLATSEEVVYLVVILVARLPLVVNLHHSTQEVQPSVNSSSRMLSPILLRPTKQRYNTISKTLFLM